MHTQFTTTACRAIVINSTIPWYNIYIYIYIVVRNPLLHLLAPSCSEDNNKQNERQAETTILYAWLSLFTLNDRGVPRYSILPGGSQVRRQALYSSTCSLSLATFYRSFYLIGPYPMRTLSGPYIYTVCGGVSCSFIWFLLHPSAQYFREQR